MSSLIRETLANLDENMLLLEEEMYDEAIIGISSDGRVAYDYDKLVEIIVKEWDCSPEDAIDHIEYNIIRSLPYFENSPIIVSTL